MPAVEWHPAVRPQRQPVPRCTLRGWEYDVDGPVSNLVRAFACHLEAVNASGCSPKTLALYDSRYKHFLTYLKEQGNAPPFGMELLDAATVRRAAVWIRERSHGRRGGQHAAKALVATLKTGSAWLADEGYLSDQIDPLARLRRPKASSGARLPLTQEDVRALAAAAVYSPTGSRDMAIIHLLLDTGMRIGGACSILVDDVDLREHRVALRLKGGRQHVLYFGSSDRRDGGRSVRALKHYIAERQETIGRWAARGSPGRDQGYLFVSFDGWPLKPKGFHTALVRLSETAGLTGVFPHRFRHTFATWYLVRHPGDETGLRGILGHLSDDMFRVYTHLAHEIIAQRAGRVALSEVWLGDESTIGPEDRLPILLNGVGSGAGYVERPSPASGKGRQEPGRLPNPRTSRRLQGSR